MSTNTTTKEPKAEVSGKEVTAEVAEVSSVDDQVLDVKALAAQLPGLEVGVKLTGKYFNPELGEEVRCFFIGNTEINAMEGEGMTTAVRLLLEDESTAITASTMIVGACRGLSIPTPIAITKTEERKLDKGKVLGVFEVTTLQ